MFPFIAFSIQAAYAAAFGPNPANNPNVFVPPSSMPHWYDKPGTMHTAILQWIGKPVQSPTEGGQAAVADISGPLVTQGVGGYHPSDIRAAYHVPAMRGAQAVAIIDAYGYNTVLSDFNVFCSQFSLPQETSADVTASSNRVLQVVYAGGTQPVENGWQLEQALDIQWVHSLAPNAKIYLVQAATNSYADLMAAEQVAANLLNVKEVSNSWGGGEFGGETNYESLFSTQGMAFFACTGDSPSALWWPSTSPNVVGVGGTSLYMNGSNVEEEIGWYNEGGGTSQVFGQPSYQSFLAGRGDTMRVTPDIAAVASNLTPVAEYNSEIGGWIEVYGTSVACPVCAAITNVNNSDNGVWANSSLNLLNQFYGWLGTKHFRDITQGNNGNGLVASVGWDNMTGMGAPLWVSPVTLTIPNPDGVVTATAGVSVSVPFAASDPANSGATITGHMISGPSWVTWDGQTLTINPPAGTRVGSYPLGLYATEPNHTVNTVSQALFINIATPKIKSVTWSSNTVHGGVSDSLTITLTNPAPIGGVTLGIVSSSGYLSLPATVTIPAGSSSVTVTGTTTSVANSIGVIATVGNKPQLLTAPMRIIP